MTRPSLNPTIEAGTSKPKIASTARPTPKGSLVSEMQTRSLKQRVKQTVKLSTKKNTQPEEQTQSIPPQTEGTERTNAENYSSTEFVKPKDVRLVKSHTPWGEATLAVGIADDIIRYHTAGHGGFYLYPSANSKIPKCFQKSSFNSQGMQGWYEEDCDAAIVVYFFKEYFSEKQFRAAIESLKSYHSAAFKSISNNQIVSKTN